MKLRDTRHEDVRLALFNTAIAFLLLWADPWGAGSSLEHAVDRWGAITTQFLYASKARDKMAAVIIDDGTLDPFNSDWHPSFPDLANIGRIIARRAAKAIISALWRFRAIKSGDPPTCLMMVDAPPADKDSKPSPCSYVTVRPQIAA